VQGAKDPLNDAVGRAQLLEELCPNVTVSYLAMLQECFFVSFV
jgi:hypothetical protein